MVLDIKAIKDVIELLRAEEQKIIKAENNNNKETFLEVGGKYLFRTVTMIYTGEIVRMTGQEIELTDAAWIADTGRFADNLKSCKFNEVEPYYYNVIIYRGALLDVTKIDHLPRNQK